jgi:hypothetical protein
LQFAIVSTAEILCEKKDASRTPLAALFQNIFASLFSTPRAIADSKNILKKSAILDASFFPHRLSANETWATNGHIRKSINSHRLLPFYQISKGALGPSSQFHVACDKG